MKTATEIEALIRKFLVDDLMVDSIEDLNNESNLFAEGYLDSVGIMQLIAHIETELETKIPPKDLTPRHFMTIQSMVNYLAPETNTLA